MSLNSSPLMHNIYLFVLFFLLALPKDVYRELNSQKREKCSMLKNLEYFSITINLIVFFWRIKSGCSFQIKVQYDALFYFIYFF